MSTETPLYDALLKYADKSPVRFHMPGHKGGYLYNGGILSSILPYDVTELSDTDNLYSANGVINEAENLAAHTFKADFTLFSAGGATLCIQAMLFCTVKKNDSIIAGRNCHKSAVNAMGLIGCDVTWVYPETDSNNLLRGLTGSDIEKALIECPDAKAVFITSPDYYGIMADVSSISKVCRRYNIPLLCDSAHGTHLHLISGNLHPLAQGADICSDSAHKTLPVMTGGAYLNSKDTFFNKNELKKAMNLFGSSSPSYPIMASLDKARQWCDAEGKAAFEKLAVICRAVKSKLSDMGFLILDGENTDPVRITVNNASIGINGFAAYDFLSQNNIICEMADNENIVLIPSPFNSESDYDKFLTAMLSLKDSLPHDYSGQKRYIVKPDKVLSINEALFSRTETVRVDSANQRICASPVYIYPPAVPVFMPGERISDTSILLSMGFRNDGIITVIKQN